MSESSQLHGLPWSFNLFFPPVCTFYPHLFCISASFSIKGIQNTWNARLLWLFEDARCSSLGWFGYTHPFRREWHTGVNFKNLSDWPIMPYSKVLTTWLEWPILGWRHSYLQRTVNHWMVGGAWKQPVDNSEFQWMLPADLHVMARVQSRQNYLAPHFLKCLLIQL